MNFFLIFIQFFVYNQCNYPSRLNIIKGINKIINNIEFPIIFNANEESLNIITSSNIYVIKKKNHSIIYQKSFKEYFPPFLLYIDESNNYFLLIEGERYKISLNGEKEILDLEEENSLENFDFMYSGWILEKDTNEFEIKDSIIYGIKENDIYFYSTSEEELLNLLIILIFLIQI